MLTAVLVTLAAVMTGLLGKFGERLFEVAGAALGRLAKPAEELDDFFINGSGTADLCVFTVTARAHRPATDVLYFEYLRHLLRTGRTRKLILVVWYPGTPAGLFATQTDGHQESYDAWLRSLFAEFGDRVEFINGRELLQQRSADPPVLFWRALDNLTSEEYYHWVRHLGLKAKRFAHMNRARPGDIVLRGLVAHTLDNAHLGERIVEELRALAAQYPHREPVMSFLFWELEVDRLAVYFELYDAGRDKELDIPPFDLQPIAGKTIRSGSSAASDNHSPSASLSLADTDLGRAAVVARLKRGELAAYQRAFRAVLVQNYEVSCDLARCASLGKSLYAQSQMRDRGKTPAPRLSSGKLGLLYLLHAVADQQAQLRATPDARAGG